MESGLDRWMILNNYYILGGTFSARNETLQAHLPLLLHPEPDKVAFLGLGTGTTAGAALLHPIRSAVVLEIVPEVIRAARDHFADANRRVVDDPRVDVLTEDARNFLKSSGRKFDVIIGDLFVPWRPGESLLFTQEHFHATRAALLPGGIYCQWLPLYQVGEEGFRIAVATFLEVYPKGMLWRGDILARQPVVALIGQKDPAPMDVAAIDRRVRDLATRVKDTNPYLTDPAGFWLHLVGMLDPHDPSYANAKRNRDNRPWLELLTSAAHLSAAADDDPKLHGRFLIRCFEQMRHLPVHGSPLEKLDARHLSWRDAGALLWEASILAAEGNEAEARAKAQRALAALPASVQTAVSGRAIPGPASP
jgi:spermidine synthase